MFFRTDVPCGEKSVCCYADTIPCNKTKAKC